MRLGMRMHGNVYTGSAAHPICAAWVIVIDLT